MLIYTGSHIKRITEYLPEYKPMDCLSPIASVGNLNFNSEHFQTTAQSFNF